DLGQTAGKPTSLILVLLVWGAAHAPYVLIVEAVLSSLKTNPIRRYPDLVPPGAAARARRRRRAAARRTGRARRARLGARARGGADRVPGRRDLPRLAPRLCPLRARLGDPLRGR